MDKKTIAKILAYIEKNCTEVEEVEEYLWLRLDETLESCECEFPKIHPKLIENDIRYDYEVYCEKCEKPVIYKGE